MARSIISTHPEDRDVARLYTQLVQTLTDFAIFMIDPDGKITTWQPGVQRNLGYAEDEFVGRNVAMIFRPEDLAAGALQTEMRTAEEQGRSPDRRWHVRKDGSLLFVDGVLNALRDDAGNLVGYSKVMRDASEWKLTQESLERSNRDLSQFAHVVSHDLQAPLRAVSLYTQLLARKCESSNDAETDQFVKFICTGVEQMQMLIEHLLSYSQIADTAREMRNVPIEQILQQALTNFQPEIEESGTVVTHDRLPSVIGDGTAFLQLFQNLIGNAIKYRADRPPQIHVSAERNGKEWLFSVRDNGIGIDSIYLRKIFEPLKRLHGSELPGTGIGLAICKRIVERFGGRIWVESIPGDGSAFYFTLPAT